MTTDLLTLLRRDHHDIAAGLTDLARPATTFPQLRAMLDGVRLGLLAHIEAEDIVVHHALMRFAPPAGLAALIEDGHREHRTQESALTALVTHRPHSPGWRERATRLRDLVVRHATYEEEVILPALRAVIPAPAWAALAGEFATQRLVQLGMLQPSAPIVSYQQLAVG